jgi:hypothetical protein
MDRDQSLMWLRGGRAGVEEWNRQRLSGEEIPSLYRADLRRADLSGADLTAADLTAADLGRADLAGAILQGADLVGADLRRADLERADLRRADLRRADLRRADLAGAILQEADLAGADLAGAACRHTLFAQVDLSTVGGLESISHLGPSTIGTDALFLSKATVPETFLRGCGLPEALISYLPGLMGSMSPTRFHSSFISYSTEDKSFAERLHADLQREGVRCWYAPVDLRIGKNFWSVIDESIRFHDKLLLVLSQHSIRCKRLGKEVETAMEEERRQKRTVLLPICLDNATMKIKGGWPADIQQSHTIGDFRGWKAQDVYQKSFDRLLSDLRASEEST